MRRSRMESFTEAVMILHLLCCKLNIQHEVIIATQAVIITDLSSGERDKALITGLVLLLCGYEDMRFALDTRAITMIDRAEDEKLIL